MPCTPCSPTAVSSAASWPHELSWERVLAEVLRLHPSIASLPLRYAIEDITLGNVTIPAGSAILTTLAAANRDPRHYGPDADRFNPDRATDPRDHLAFGIGVHHCIGQPLALMEAEAALSSLFERFPALRLAPTSDEPANVPSFIANGPSTLDVTLSAPPIPRTIAGKRLTDSERDALTAYALYAYDGGRPEGDRIRTIAENIGWSYTATHKILSEAGAPMRSRGGNTRSGTKQLT